MLIPMIAFDACPTCRTLLMAVQGATQRHIRAVSRLQSAGVDDDPELAAALAVVVKEAAQARQDATAAYRDHRTWHEWAGIMAETGAGSGLASR